MLTIGALGVIGTASNVWRDGSRTMSTGSSLKALATGSPWSSLVGSSLPGRLFLKILRWAQGLAPAREEALFYIGSAGPTLCRLALERRAWPKVAPCPWRTRCSTCRQESSGQPARRAAQDKLARSASQRIVSGRIITVDGDAGSVTLV